MDGWRAAPPRARSGGVPGLGTWGLLRLARQTMAQMELRRSLREQAEQTARAAGASFIVDGVPGNRCLC